MNNYTIILLVLLVASCNPGHYKSVRVDSGLEGGCESILFPSSSIGLLGGYTIKDSIPWGTGVGNWQFNAICWRTIDGGRNWRSQKIADGTFSELTVKDGIVYAIISTGDAKGGSKYKIYESSNLGEIWKYKCEVFKSIVRVHVMDSNWIIGDIGGRLGETRDGGKSWHVLESRNFVGRSFYHDKYVYYFSSTQQDGSFKLFVRRNLYTGEEKKMTLPDGFSGENGKENIMFCSKDKELRVYRINDDFTLTYLSTIKQEIIAGVDYVGIYNEHIFIFANFISPGFFRDYDSFYYSSDGGLNWKRLGHRRLITGGRGKITDYTDSTGFKVYFYIDPYTLGSFSVSAENDKT